MEKDLYFFFSITQVVDNFYEAINFIYLIIS